MSETVRKVAVALLKVQAEAASYGCDQIADAHLRAQAEQVTRVVAACRKHTPMILRDPVGTGKTAVALTAVRILLDAGVVDYALCVAPKALVATQWRERAVLPLAQRLAPSGSTWRPGKLLVATAQKVPKRPSPAPDRTLVIVDEAHRGLQDRDAMAHQRLQPLATGARLLLVTATPFQLTTEGLTTMLDVGGGVDERGAESLRQYGRCLRDFLKAWQQHGESRELEPLAVAVERLKPAAEMAMRRHLLPVTSIVVPPMPKVERSLIPLRGWATAYATARVTPELLGERNSDAFQRSITSSSEAFWDEGYSWGSVLAKVSRNRDARILALLDQLEQHLGRGTDHPKVAATTAWVGKQVKVAANVLVFTGWRATRDTLEETLQDAIPDADVHAPKGERIPRSIIQQFRRPPDRRHRPIVLILSDRFSESIDLDGGKPSLVHHDLAWNPVRLEQRWGRVVRILSQFAAVPKERIYVPVLDVEVDRRLADVVLGRSDLAHLMIPSQEGTSPDGWELPDKWLQRIAANIV